MWNDKTINRQKDETTGFQGGHYKTRPRGYVHS